MVKLSLKNKTELRLIARIASSVAPSQFLGSGYDDRLAELILPKTWWRLTDQEIIDRWTECETLAKQEIDKIRKAKGLSTKATFPINVFNWINNYFLHEQFVDKLLGKAQDLRGQEKEALGLALQFLGPEKFISLKVATKTPEQTLEILKKYEPKQ